MHCAAVDQTFQGLGCHGPLHGMEFIRGRAPVEGVDIQTSQAKGGKQVREIDWHGVRSHFFIGVSEVPGQLIHVTERVTTRATLSAIRRGGQRVVEKRSAGDDIRRLGIMQGQMMRLGAGRCVDHRNSVIKARHHVKGRPIRREGDPTRPTRTEADLLILIGCERICFQGRCIEYSDFRRTKGGHIKGRAAESGIVVDRHFERCRQTLSGRREIKGWITRQY